MSAVPQKEEGRIIVEESARGAGRQLPTVAADASSLMKIIDRAAMDPNFDVAKLEKLLAVRDQWEANEARKAYNAAFANFKAEAIVVVKNRGVTDGPLKGKRYAELHSVVDAVTPLLSKYGLSHAWNVKSDKDTIAVTSSGIRSPSRSTVLQMPAARRTPSRRARARSPTSSATRSRRCAASLSRATTTTATAKAVSGRKKRPST
jgi:hypothetical protein